MNPTDLKALSSVARDDGQQRALRRQRQDTLKKEALSLCKAAERLWVTPRPSDTQPASALSCILAQVARERWGAGAERMLAHLKVIVAAAEEALHEPQ